jgi:hypothetical protein
VESRGRNKAAGCALRRKREEKKEKEGKRIWKNSQT